MTDKFAVAKSGGCWHEPYLLQHSLAVEQITGTGNEWNKSYQINLSVHQVSRYLEFLKSVPRIDFSNVESRTIARRDMREVLVGHFNESEAQAVFVGTGA